MTGRIPAPTLREILDFLTGGYSSTGSRQGCIDAIELALRPVAKKPRKRKALK